MKKQIQEFWVSNWDYISLSDAIIEARNAGYDEPTIKELQTAYREVEEFQ